MNKNNLHSAFTFVDEISQLHNVLKAYTLQNVNNMANMEWCNFGLYFPPPHLSSLVLFCENIPKFHQAEDRKVLPEKLRFQAPTDMDWMYFLKLLLVQIHKNQNPRMISCVKSYTCFTLIKASCGNFPCCKLKPHKQ